MDSFLCFMRLATLAVDANDCLESKNAGHQNKIQDVLSAH